MYWKWKFTPEYRGVLNSASKKLDDIDNAMEKAGVPYYNKNDLKYRILASPSLTGMDGNTIDKVSIPVYVSSSPDDKATIGILPTKDGKYKIFEGNEEASEDTLDLVNDLTGAGEKLVTVYGSHTSDVIDRIKRGDFPTGIFVSPKREVAEGYFGADREVVKFKIPLSRIAQHSDVDWQIREEKKKRSG